MPSLPVELDHLGNLAVEVNYQMGRRLEPRQLERVDSAARRRSSRPVHDDVARADLAALIGLMLRFKLEAGQKEVGVVVSDDEETVYYGF